MIGNFDNLELAAKEAIRTWILSEKKLSGQLLNISEITEDILKQWLGYWMLARSNPTYLRAELAKQLNELVRPSILNSSNEDLPLQIQFLTEELKKRNATKGKQTSLVSKIAFCLKPEIIVPYDKRARSGLTKVYGKKMIDHDYASYYKSFLQFKDEIDDKLEASSVLENLRSDWQSAMSENLFKARTADKFLMLIGGFSVEKMAKAVQGVFN